MRYFWVQTVERGAADVRFPRDDEEARATARGDRVLFYQLRGDGESRRGLFVAWGEVERLSTEGDEGRVHLKAVTPLKRPIPFGELRADPRRNREAAVQPVSAEVFNVVLARSRR